MSNERKPEWLKIKYKTNKNSADVTKILQTYGLNTVCDEAMCPNKAECFSNRTATFMILGNNCTRRCTFCNVNKDIPSEPDPKEPGKIAKAVKELLLEYVVITSVTRDDLPDGGAFVFAECINRIKELDQSIKVEVLIPDFKGDIESLRTVIKAKPFVLNHNVETVERLYPEVRPQGVYQRSLELLKNVKDIDGSIYTKSGIMVGLGETKDEVMQTIKDIADCGVKLLTIGQYLAPSKAHHKVIEYVHPDVFAEYKKEALKLGFLFAASGPFVRSSYNAKEAAGI